MTPHPSTDPLVVSIIDVAPRGAGLVSVSMRLADGRPVVLVMATRHLDVGRVQMAAAAVAAVYSLSDTPMERAI